METAIEFFGAIPTENKRLALWPGGHTALPVEAIDLSIRFLNNAINGHQHSVTADAW